MQRDPDRELVGRGALVALGALPAAILLTLPPIPFERLWLGVVCLALPFAARFLYTRGSGGYVIRGRTAIAAVSIASVLLAAVTSTMVTSHTAYADSGGTGAILSPDFLTAVAFNFANFTSFDLFFSLLVALITGGPALALALVTAPKPPIRRISESTAA